MSNIKTLKLSMLEKEQLIELCGLVLYELYDKHGYTLNEIKNMINKYIEQKE